MRVFTLIIVVLSLLAILEFTSVIPSTSFSILNSFSQIAAFIKSLNIESYYIIISQYIYYASRNNNYIDYSFFSWLYFRKIQKI